jgi:hypothetical protein
MDEDEPKQSRVQREDASVPVLVDEEELLAGTPSKGNVRNCCQAFVPWGQVNHATEDK